MSRTPIALCLGLALGAPLLADEGMWTFDSPPAQRLAERYGFTAAPEWLTRARLASVRFMDGGSGSFVSPEGLIVTNHHVGRACIQNLSSAERDLNAAGFLAETRDRELACPGYEVNVLLSTEDVSARVIGAAGPELSDQVAGEARRAARARIEKECADATRLRCDVIELYHGGEYHLYRYRKYTDVRLVFAPEEQIAFFGGDPDNFTFPRHDLDVAFFRAYEEGRPARPPAYLAWSRSGAAEGDLVFVSGNPGSTSRLKTLSQLEALRDAWIPDALAFLEGRLAALRDYAAGGPESARRAQSQIFGYENSLKAWRGRLDALRDAKAIAEKAAAERALRERVAGDPRLREAVGDPWSAIEATTRKHVSRLAELRWVGFGGSRLFGIAGNLVRLAAEKQKPNEQRLKEYRESALPSLETRLYSTAPIYDDLEIATLRDQLERAVAALGKAHPFVKTALQGQAPAELAREVVSGTSLDDVAARRALAAGGAQAVAAASDPMVALARRVDPLARELRKWEEDEIEATLERAGQELAQARWRVYGKALPPDATFTLRLSYGTVKPYPAEGTLVAPFTTFHGLYDRAAAWGGKPPWNLPQRWVERKHALDLATPLNLVSTADIIGGNSGSPTLDRKGEFVGIIFDGNIQSLALDYFYTEDQARAVSVDARGILEALGKVYDAHGLVEELTRR